MKKTEIRPLQMERSVMFVRTEDQVAGALAYLCSILNHTTLTVLVAHTASSLEILYLLSASKIAITFQSWTVVERRLGALVQ